MGVVPSRSSRFPRHERLAPADKPRRFERKRGVSPPFVIADGPSGPPPSVAGIHFPPSHGVWLDGLDALRRHLGELDHHRGLGALAHLGQIGFSAACWRRCKGRGSPA